MKTLFAILVVAVLVGSMVILIPLLWKEVLIVTTGNEQLCGTIAQIPRQPGEVYLASINGRRLVVSEAPQQLLPLIEGGGYTFDYSGRTLAVVAGGCRE